MMLCGGRKEDNTCKFVDVGGRWVVKCRSKDEGEANTVTEVIIL